MISRIHLYSQFSQLGSGVRQQTLFPPSAVGGGQGLTNALSSLHCFPGAHSSATGKEYRAGLLAPLLAFLGGWYLRPGMQAHWGGASAWGEGCPLTPEAQAWLESQVSMEKGVNWAGGGEGL
jgi:hypothetical protein